MQVAVIEYTRNVLKFEDANSAEFNKETSCPVVMFMPEGSTTEMGGTMRLGARKTIFQDKGSLACQLYGGQTEVMERHRHRYEVIYPLSSDIREHEYPLRMPFSSSTTTTHPPLPLPLIHHSSTTSHSPLLPPPPSPPPPPLQVNPEYIAALEKAGLILTGRDETGNQCDVRVSVRWL
jgi:CTP synthase (UTP-ammonia lyase)